MPTLKLKRIREKYIPYKHKESGQSFYRSTSWHMLRNNYMSTHPLCEECLLEGRTTAATDIHHKKEFMLGATDEEKWKLFLDYNNLQALCEEHHYKIHSERRKNRKNLLSN